MSTGGAEGGPESPGPGPPGPGSSEGGLLGVSGTGVPTEGGAELLRWAAATSGSGPWSPDPEETALVAGGSPYAQAGATANPTATRAALVPAANLRSMVSLLRHDRAGDALRRKKVPSGTV